MERWVGGWRGGSREDVDRKMGGSVDCTVWVNVTSQSHKLEALGDAKYYIDMDLLICGL